MNSNPTYFGLIPEGEEDGPWATQTVKTGPNTYESSMVVYTTKKGAGPLSETVSFVTTKAKWTITGPDANEGTATQSVYLAKQDADSDGLPDPGQQPTICMAFTYTSKRLKSMPGCVPWCKAGSTTTPCPETATASTSSGRRWLGSGGTSYDAAARSPVAGRGTG